MAREVFFCWACLLWYPRSRWPNRSYADGPTCPNCKSQEMMILQPGHEKAIADRKR